MFHVGLQSLLHANAGSTDSFVDGTRGRRKPADHRAEPSDQPDIHGQGSCLHGRRRRTTVRSNTSQAAARRYCTDVLQSTSFTAV